MKRGLYIIVLLTAACSRGPEGTEQGDCRDSRDNDLDGKYDCDDDGCIASNICVEQARKAKEEAEAREKTRTEELQKRKADLEGAKKEAFGPFFSAEELLIQTATNGKDVNWHGAESYCKDLKLAGKSGWRLPNRNEALQIVRSGKLSNEPSYVMWTSTKRGKKRAVIVGISNGAVNDLATRFDGDCRARCVLDAKQ